MPLVSPPAARVPRKGAVGGPFVGAIGKAVSLPAALVASSLFYVPLLGLYGRAARSEHSLEAGAEAVAPVR